MTKARDLANIISGGFTESDIPNLSASKITSGSIDTARLGNIDLTNLSASNLTSGSIPDARVPASAVSQHATSFDDNKIVNDISTLAIRQASNENKSAYNTNSMYVDVFQDGTGIASNTNAPRNASEFVATTYTTIGEFSNDSNTVALYHFNNSLADSSSNGANLTNHNSSYATFETSDKKFGTHSLKMHGNSNMAVYTGSLSDNDSAVTAPSTGAFTLEMWIKYIGRSGTDRIAMLDNRNSDTPPFTSGGTPYLSFGFNDNYLNVYGRHGSDHNWDVPNTATGSTYTTSAFQHHAIERDGSGNLHYYIDGVFKGEQSGWGQSLFTEYRRLVFGQRTGTTSESYNGFIDEVRYSNIERYGGSNFTPNQVTASSATGNFISNAITAPSSVSKMGAIITYQDNAGTNTLNTDVILKLSADNGSNYSTATLTAMPDFASGIKMAKVNDLSVTAGTQLKYKIEFANQASGSKEARIRGVSLQY